jgi:hypothetical protein
LDAVALGHISSKVRHRKQLPAVPAGTGDAQGGRFGVPANHTQYVLHGFKGD